MMVLIPADSGWPVSCHQFRLGAHGVRLMTIKFSVMARGDRDDTDPVLSADGDSRKAWVGRFLRQRSVVLSDIYVILKALRMFFLPARRKWVLA